MRATKQAACSLMAVMLVACGTTFHAVSATGKLGQRIDGAVALGASSQICREMKALSRGSAADCAAQEKTSATWSKIADALSAYATKLSALADQDDVNPSNQVAAALSAASKAQWGQLTSDQNDAIAGFAKAVTGVLSMTYRAGILDDVIRDLDPHIQRVAALLEGEIDLRVAQIDGLSGASMQVQQGMQSVPPAPKFPPAPPLVTRPGPPRQAAAAPAAHVTGKPAPPDASSDTSFETWQREFDRQLESSMADQAAVNQVLGQGGGVALSIVLQDLVAKKDVYAQLKATVAAFRASHALLAKNVGHLNASDLLPQIVELIQSTVSLATSFKSGRAASTEND